MAEVGCWGRELVFSVSDSRILTFDRLTRTVSATWARHTRTGKKDSCEFIKPEVQSVSLTVTLDAQLGVRPAAMLARLEKAIEKGTVNVLVIGGKRIGSGRFYISQASEVWSCVMSRGELMRAEVTLTMEEYI